MGSLLVLCYTPSDLGKTTKSQSLDLNDVHKQAKVGYISRAFYDRTNMLITVVWKRGVVYG